MKLNSTTTLALLALATAPLTIAGTGCAPAQAQQPPASAGAADWIWKKRLAPGAVVDLRNLNGSIEAGPSSGSEVEVVAHKSTRKGNLAQVGIAVEETDKGVVICAVRTEGGAAPTSCRNHNDHDRDNRDGDHTVVVDFAIKVPAGLRLEGRTVNGSIKVVQLGGPADLRTVNGSVQVDAAGAVEARTVNGNITARMGRTDWKGELSLRTVNGAVDIEMPAAASTEVSIATVNGAIQSDFALSTEGRFGPQKATGTIGAGGRSLSVRSVNGAIRLRRGG